MFTSRRLVALLCGTGLLLAACGGPKANNAPPAVNRSLLAGKWEAREKEQLFQTIEFKDDKSFLLTIYQMPASVTGTYSWSGDTAITLEYQFTDESKKTCMDALAAYRQHLKDRAKAGGGQYEQQITSSASHYDDELLEKQEWRINITEGANADLILKTAKGLEFVFKKGK
jgi:hypothetical protein